MHIPDLRRTTLHPLLFLSLLILSSFLLYLFVVLDSNAEIELELQLESPPAHSFVRLFFSDQGQSWSQIRSAALPAMAGKHTYHFRLGNIGRLERLRLDPADYPGRALLSSVTISQSGYRSRRLVGASLAEAVRANAPTKTRLTLEQDGLEIDSTGDDPQLLLSPQLDFVGWGWEELSRPFLLLLFSIPLLWLCFRRTADRAAFVPILLFGVWVLALVMAAESRPNAHPDEYVHLAAQHYYESHWLPPALDDPSIAGTYSVYGHSRLDSGEICYLLMGRVAAALEPLHMPQPLASRVFQLLLLGLIISAALHSFTARLVALPLLLTPQCWYLFSYCNSDAFSLFMAWLTSWQAVEKGSLLRRVLTGDHPRWWHWPLCVLLVGGLLMVKQNWLPFIVLLGFFLLLVLWFGRESGKRWWPRAALLVVLAGLLPMGKLVVTHQVNHWQLAEVRQEMQGHYARHAWHPDTPLAEKMPSLALRERGMGWKQALFAKGWLEKSFDSGFGIFGYTDVSAPEEWYFLARIGAGCFLAGFFLFYFSRGKPVENLTGLTAIALAGALIAVSFYHSWTMDFQPQGRYLFPVLSMLGLLCGLRDRGLRSRFVLVPLSGLYLLGLWFFLFVGLPALG